MAPQNIIQLIQALDEKTKQGLLKWELTEDESVYLLAFPDNSVTISCEAPYDPIREGRYIVRIYNEDGTLIDLYSEDDLEPQYSSGEAWEILREIHDGARRKARGSDEAINKILSNLESVTSTKENLSRYFR